MINYINMWDEGFADSLSFEISINGEQYDGRYLHLREDDRFAWNEAPDEWETAEEIIEDFYLDYYLSKEERKSTFQEIEIGDFFLVRLEGCEDFPSFPSFFPCHVFGNWNGWDCITMTRPTTELFVESMAKLGDGASFLFIWDGDDLIAIERQYIDGEDNPVQVIKPNESGEYDVSLSLCWSRI